MQFTCNNKTRLRKAGFSLIELLVVLSIISLLATVVLAAVRSAQTKASVAKARADMYTFMKVLAHAQGASGKTLEKMSSDGGASIPNCSMCVTECAPGGDFRNITDACYVEWTKVLAGVKMNADSLGDNLLGMNRDPWGSPYFVDQNQGESASSTRCADRDGFVSAGPDGKRGTGDDLTMTTLMPLAGTCP